MNLENTPPGTVRTAPARPPHPGGARAAGHHPTSGVLDRRPWPVAWGVRSSRKGTRMAYVICEPCVGVKDRGCAEVCPVNCIHDGEKDGFPDMLFIEPDVCIDCDLCPHECPVDAIFPEDEVPDRWQRYIA